MARHVAAFAVLLALLVAAPAEARTCHRFTAGTAGFDRVTATGVTCQRARQLFAAATLSSVRRGRATWTYRAWRFASRDLDEFSRRLTGRHGAARIAATWSQS